jgi:uncharacterized protein (DUF4415 family)
MQKTIKTRSGRVLILPSPEEEAQINAGIAADPDNPEWTDEMFARARPAREFFSPEVYAELCAMRQRGPKEKPLKVPTTIRFDADVLAALKASGKGWQTRVNDAVKDWLRTHSPV